MSAKRALIVDDSRSARAFLTRILERYDLQVDSAESAEEAIEYLNRQRPDVIFLDHLMPGMDGFQALAVIKNDPRTATIPVMMYTSQEGELYLSQARALGAMGVLPKQTKPADVSRALEQLKLLGERPPESEIATVRVASLHAADVPLASGGDSGERRALSSPALMPASPLPATPPMTTPPPAGLPPELRAHLDTLLRDHGIELRRFVAQSLEQHAARIVAEVRSLMDEAVGQAAEPEPVPEAMVAPPVPVSRGSRDVLWLSLAAALIAAVAGVLWYRSAGDEQPLPKPAAVVRPVAGPVVPPAAVEAPDAQAASHDMASRDVAGRDAPALVETVPFGESPFAGARLDHVQALLDRLSASGFRGSVEIRSFPGRFCLQGSGDAATLPPADTNYSKCDLVGNPVDANSPAGRESVAFANMLAALRSRGTGALDVQLTAGRADEVVAPYPAVSEPLTAGEWNRAAAANNRVEVRARPFP